MHECDYSLGFQETPSESQIHTVYTDYEEFWNKNDLADNHEYQKEKYSRSVFNLQEDGD